MGNGRQGWEIAQLKCCSSQRLYTWGSGARGQLGTGSLQAVRFPSGRLVRSIACGREHCVAVTYDGNAYAWGKGDKAWLPLGLVQGVADVLVCAAGEDHTGAICRGEDDNELRPYMWGSSEMGKLGVGAAGLSSTDSPPVVVKVPVALSCGQYHTAVVCALRGDSEDDSEDRIAGRALALAEDGLTSIRSPGVWTFGGGWYGRLGHNNMENQFEPKLVQSLLARVRSVHCGALSYEKGVINDNGEPAGDLWVPIKFMQIDGQPKDRDESTRLFPATSDLTNMIVTSAGLVYAWGDNRSGQIGLDGGRKGQLRYFIFHQAIFQILTDLAQLCIGGNLPQPPILMSAGPAHMVTYGRNKVMMAWGNQSCGRLGLQEKKMEKVIFKPRVVRAEWASIEAMGGTEAEEEGGDKKKVTAAALATLGDESISKALDSESAISEGSSHGEFGEEDAGDTKANLLHAFTSGQKVQRFSTMQTMLKEEPDSNKTGGSLHKHTKAVGVMLALYELKKMVVSAVEDLVTVTEKERRVAMFQERVQKGIDHLNGVLQGPVQHERERDGLDAALMQKLPAYQELFSVLQLQAFFGAGRETFCGGRYGDVSYLATLSMTIKDEEASEVFVKVVCAIFADLHDARIRNLFVLLMQMMVFKELEQSKHIDDVFLPASRTFKLFSFFALHEVHFDSVVQPLMDCHRMDEQNQPLTFMGLVTYKTLERGQTWSLDFNDYLKSPSIAAKLKEQAAQELRADFTKELEAFYDFFKVDVVSAISRLHLPASFWSFLAFCRETIKEFQLVGTEEDEAGTEVGGDPRVELQMCEPLFRLLISGIILPVLSHPKKYGGREVGLWRCEKGNFDGDVLFNLRAVVAAFEDMVLIVPSGKKALNKIGSRLRPEVLRFILERLVTGGDEPDTIVTVQTFLSHYDRVPTSIYVSTSQLVLFQNMILNNVNKIRLTSGDPLDEAAKKVGPWSEEFVKEAKGKADKGLEVLYRLEIQHRFFFTDRSMTVCPASKCTVPRRLSSAAGSESQRADEGDVSQNVDVIRTLKEDNPHKVLEDLFRHLPPLTATNFQDLQTEFEALLAQFAAAENDFWEKKLSQGLAAVGDLIDTETSPEEVLDTMASVILARNRHSRYLQSVLAGLSQLGAARDRHGEEIRRPTRILEAAKAESTILRGSEINFLIRKQDARVRTKTGNKVGLLDDDGFLLEFVKEFPILESMIKQVALADRNATIGLPPEGPVLMKWKSMELASILKSVPPADCAVSEADASDLRSSPDHSLPEKRSRDVEALSHLWNSCLLDGGDLSDVSPLVRITTPKKQEVINSSQSQKRSVAWKHVLLLEDAQNTRIIESTEDLEGFELLRPEDRT
ncbi:HERC1 [Symbiodinium necroappetens]|uniref:HERC1 protein n=1 Tax=Symbiodinium necroappetens TaxID=1628268 RepID=A0A812J8M1_9DINO|nr:HERC1 [Symbiodinium necroappetens]